MQSNTGSVLVFTDGMTRRIATIKWITILYKVGKMIGFMKNSSKTSSVPLKGWMVYDSAIKDFHKDISVQRRKEV